MATLELSDEQIITLLEQLPDEQKQRIAARLLQSAPARPRPQFGSANDDILYIAEDFDAPLDDFKEYTQ